MDTPTAKKHINTLTASRGIAALIVVIYHFGREIYPFNEAERFFNGSSITVSYFFVLSGFVMSWMYLEREVGYVDFVKRRAVRILPFYYLAIVLSILLLGYYYLSADVPMEQEIGTKLLLNLTLTQAYFINYPLSINPTGWSLSVEMFFYLLFPFLLKIQKSKRSLFSLIVVIIYVGTQILHHYQLRAGAPLTEQQHNFTFYFPLFHLNEFLVGMAGATLLPKVKKSGIRIPIILTLAAIISAIIFRPRGLDYFNGLLAPLFLLLILGMSVKDKGWINNRVMVYVGEMTYGIYILQFPVNSIFQQYNSRYFHLPATAAFYTYLAVLFLITVIAYYLVEKPLRNIMLHRKVTK